MNVLRNDVENERLQRSAVSRFFPTEKAQGI